MQRRRIHQLELIGPTIVLVVGLISGPVMPWPEPASALAAESLPLSGDVMDVGVVISEAVTIHGGDPDTVSLIHRAVARFDLIGLVLPAIEFFVHHDGKAACEGHRGYWHHHPTTDRIDICVPSESLVLHELAHAWEYHAVDDATRNAFMALYPDEAWADEDAQHSAQGIERFADAVTWGLESRSDQTGVVMSRHAATVHQHNIDTFMLITGEEPPRLTDPI